MAVEIERKFLLASDEWRHAAKSGVQLAQGYLSSDPSCSIRVRVAGDQAWLNIKGATVEISRPEFEFAIPLVEGQTILETLARRPFIEKTRYEIPVGQHVFEVDEFHGDNAGLVVAEVELASTDEVFERPDWLGIEVSDDARYLNAALVNHPYCDWAAEAS